MSNKQDILAGPYARFYERFGDPTEELHTYYYPRWLNEMANREGSRLEPFEFNLDLHPEQSIYVPKVDAVPASPGTRDTLYYLEFKRRMIKSLGFLSTGQLVRQLRRQPTSSEDSTSLPKRLNRNQQEGKNTLVVTSHINFQELGYVRAIRHMAKKDRENIDKCGVLFNLLMSRQKYKGKKLVDLFTPVGNVYFSSPKSKSAEKYGIPDGASSLTNALFKKAIKPDLEKGGLELDAALTGSEIKPIKNEDNTFSHYFIPDIDHSSAKLVEHFDEAVAITLVGPPILDSWNMHISEVLDVQELLKTNDYAQVTDMLYADNIVGAVERFTGRDVAYNRLASKIGATAISAN